MRQTALRRRCALHHQTALKRCHEQSLVHRAQLPLVLCLAHEISTFCSHTTQSCTPQRRTAYHGRQPTTCKKPAPHCQYLSLTTSVLLILTLVCCAAVPAPALWARMQLGAYNSPIAWKCALLLFPARHCQVWRCSHEREGCACKRSVETVTNCFVGAYQTRRCTV